MQIVVRCFGKTDSESTITPINDLEKQIPSDNRKFLEQCAYYKNNWLSRLSLAFNRSIYQYGSSERFGVFFMVLTGRF